MKRAQLTLRSGERLQLHAVVVRADGVVGYTRSSTARTRVAVAALGIAGIRRRTLSPGRTVALIPALALVAPRRMWSGHGVLVRDLAAALIQHGVAAVGVALVCLACASALIRFRRS